MSQGASFMATTQSFASVASSFNINCSSSRCEGCEQQHEYFIIRVQMKMLWLLPLIRFSFDGYYIDEILSLMRERKLRYPEHYDSTN
ncbi:hypothetical protein H5410_031585 [Solanum commersonii]|uniref:Uncharacterized protein n=1 Tax=Solanum commersonii TaxID=4109 RepID=A0A9J5YKD0_SOLCO|nr:hypothetical protein H5410_031585 [Solanum commersonii]